jgi:hypothetical protein
MPLFRKGEDVVEAYRLPAQGAEPSDGLVFFLVENGCPLHLVPRLCAAHSGCWMLLAPNKMLLPYGHEKFLEDFERV